MPTEIVSQLIQARQTVMPKRLCVPGPSAAQLNHILEAAAAAPDHGQITPWRFVIIEKHARSKLADVFVKALEERDNLATEEEISRAADKAYRAPLLMLAIGKMPSQDNSPDNAFSTTERLISAGCAIQNMLLMATAQGFGSALTSGKALSSVALAQLFDLKPNELALCFISIGTVHAKKPRFGRPLVAAFTSTLN